jgi:hypothetical protein
MVVVSQEGCARERAEHCDVRFVVLRLAFSQFFTRRHIDWSTKGTGLAELHIVYEFDHEGAFIGILLDR